MLVYQGVNGITGWWMLVVYLPSEKYEFVSGDDDIPNWMESHKKMFQTTNQCSQSRFCDWIGLISLIHWSPFLALCFSFFHVFPPYFFSLFISLLVNLFITLCFLRSYLPNMSPYFSLFYLCVEIAQSFFSLLTSLLVSLFIPMFRLVFLPIWMCLEMADARQMGFGNLNVWWTIRVSGSQWQSQFLPSVFPCNYLSILMSLFFSLLIYLFFSLLVLVRFRRFLVLRTQSWFYSATETRKCRTVSIMLPFSLRSLDWFWRWFGSVSKPCTPGEHQNRW